MRVINTAVDKPAIIKVVNELTSVLVKKIALVNRIRIDATCATIMPHLLLFLFIFLISLLCL